MSSTTSRAPAKEAPWKADFLKHIEAMPQPLFVLGTLAETPSLHNPDAPSAPTAHTPRVRYVIYRGMWAELPENKRNEAEKNPRVYESDCPIFTTDVRMHKVEELFTSSAGQATSPEQTKGSGGGGAVEAVWWAEKDKEGGLILQQWRMRGTAFVIGEDIEGEEEGRSGARTVKSQLGERMRVVDEAKVGDWSWKRELSAVFGNQSPQNRGYFRQPPPGRPVSEPYDKSNLKLGLKVEGLDDETARANFRVVVIKPDYVERIDLNASDEGGRRHAYTFEDSEWKYEECWP